MTAERWGAFLDGMERDATMAMVQLEAGDLREFRATPVPNDAGPVPVELRDRAIEVLRTATEAETAIAEAMRALMVQLQGEHRGTRPSPGPSLFDFSA